jgi:hypothetical protein
MLNPSTQPRRLIPERDPDALAKMSAYMNEEKLLLSFGFMFNVVKNLVFARKAKAQFHTFNEEWICTEKELHSQRHSNSNE